MSEQPRNIKFSVGLKLSDRSACDHECIFTGTVAKRTAKRVTITGTIYGEVTVGIKTDDNGNEYCYPFGRYSMAPCFEAAFPAIKEDAPQPEAVTVPENVIAHNFRA